MKTNNTLSISYDTDATNQNNIAYNFDLRQGGQSIYADEKMVENIKILVADNQGFENQKKWPAMVIDGQLTAMSTDFPFTDQSGEYYVTVDYLGTIQPSSGFTTLTLGAEEQENLQYDMRPTLEGKPGTGIRNITAKGDQLTISLTNGKIKTLTIPTVKGDPGKNGKDGQPGPSGAGITSIEYVEGLLKIDLDDGSSQTVDIPTVQGDPGKQGPAGVGIESITSNSDASITVNTTDGNSYQVAVPTVQGEPGPSGKDGASITSITQNGNVITFHFSDGNSQSLTVSTVKGDPGAAGVGIASIEQSGSDQLTVHLTNGQAQTFTIPSIKGDQGEPGSQGAPGAQGVGISDIRQGSTSVTNNQAVTNIIITLTNGSEKTLQITTPGGPTGAQGLPGKTGRGIDTITAGQATGELTFRLTDGTTQSVQVPTVQGPAGKDGASITGPAGPAGKDGDRITGITAAGSKLDIKTTSADYAVDIPTVKGDQGEPGQQGQPGVGIQNITSDNKGLITITTTDGNSYQVTVPTVTQSPDGSATKNIYITNITQAGNKITVELNDGDKREFMIPTLQGPAGKDGQSIQGPAGDPGKDGVSITGITQDGATITVKTSDGKSYPFTVPTIKGDQGLPGNGISSVAKTDNDQITFNFTDGSSSTFKIPTVQGPAGQNGTGIASMSTQGQELTINLTDGSKKTFTIPAAQGVKGDPGAAGVGLTGKVGVSSSNSPTGTYITVALGLTNGKTADFNFTVPNGQPGPKGDPGESITGPAGPAGAPGKDGRSINSVTRNGNNLLFKIDNDVISTVELPMPSKFVTDVTSDYSTGRITKHYNNGKTENLNVNGLLKSRPDVYSVNTDSLGYPQMMMSIDTTGDNTYVTEPYMTEQVLHDIAKEAKSRYVDGNKLYLKLGNIAMYRYKNNNNNGLLDAAILNNSVNFIRNLKISGNQLTSVTWLRENPTLLDQLKKISPSGYASVNYPTQYTLDGSVVGLSELHYDEILLKVLDMSTFNNTLFFFLGDSEGGTSDLYTGSTNVARYGITTYQLSYIWIVLTFQNEL